MKKFILTLIPFLLFSLITLAQTDQFRAIDTLTLTLDDVVQLAQSESPNASIADTRLSNNYWQYRSFLGDYRPRIDLALDSDLNRSINDITQPDGSIRFISQSNMSNEANIFLSQDITATGGTIFFSTGLQRIDFFETEAQDYSKLFLNNPVSLNIRQPIFAFNRLKWNKIIEPLRFEESKRRFSEDMENIAFDAANRFFNVLIAQLNLQAALRDKSNADTLLQISRGRFEVGRIAETELLQIELQAMNADADLAAQTLNLQTNTERLRDFLGIQEAVYFKLIPPAEIPDFVIDPGKALSAAIRNRRETVQFERRIAEGESDLARAKAGRTPEIDITGRFGLSQTNNTLSDAYDDLLSQERVGVSINIPIADWGKSRAELEIARSNYELTQLIVNRDRINFERDILVNVQQFELKRQQVRIALRAYEVAQKRLSITRERYRISELQVNDLNIAISEEANSRATYISALREFWLGYYDIRRQTLYDFREDVSLKREVREE